MRKKVDEVKNWYLEYYKDRPFRNSIRFNSQVLFQILAMEASIVSAVRCIDHNPNTSKILDVGCGEGNDIFHFLRLDYKVSNITGIDINSDRLQHASETFPTATFVFGDASAMGFATGSFDLVFESTMFSTLPDDKLCTAIGNEMVRVCKSDGYLVLVDWRFKKPKNPNYNALNRKKLRAFFGVGTKTALVTMQNGALIPPLGRFISKYSPPIYFLVAKFFPFLVGQVVYVLKKIE